MDASLLFFDVALGAAAFFSPCGVPMLPAYVAYYMGRGDDINGAGNLGYLPRLARGLAGGAVAALGAFLVIASIGAFAVLIGAPFKARVLHLELVGALVTLALGALVLAGRGPSARFALRASTRRGALGLFSFGALYALVAASCVAPLFLTVLVQAATSSGGAWAVVAYALGMGALLVAITALVAVAQPRAVAMLRAIVPHVERASGVVLIAVGLYLVYYWARVAL